MRTRYAICLSLDDYAACRAAYARWCGNAAPLAPLVFPTVRALRDGECIGFLGSIAVEGFLCAGPLHFAPHIHRKGLLIRRLLREYEAILESADIAAYYFFVTADTPWYHQVCAAMGKKEVVRSGADAWFRRDFSTEETPIWVERLTIPR